MTLNIFVFAADEVMSTDEAAHLDETHKAMIKDLFSQGVKHKMRVNLVRQISKPSSKKRWNESDKKNYDFQQVDSPAFLVVKTV